MRVRSYCLKVGTRSPGPGGEGYLDAPLRGPRADVIRTLLTQSPRHREIAQKDLQLLIWSVLAHVNPKDMEPRLQKAAFRLLSPAQIATLEAGALDALVNPLMEEALSRLPAPVQELRRIEQDVRNALSQGGVSYESIEHIAVPGPRADRGTSVPLGRWSQIAPAIYVRYRPTSYTETLVQLYVANDSGFTAAPAYHSPGGSVAAAVYELLLADHVAYPAADNEQRLGLSPIEFDPRALNPASIVGANTDALPDKACDSGLPMRMLGTVLGAYGVWFLGTVPNTRPSLLLIQIDPEQGAKLTDPKISPMEAADAWNTLYHEAMHGAVGLAQSKDPGFDDAGWQRFVRDGPSYYHDAPMKGGGTTTDPDKLFQEAVAGYVGDRVSGYLNALHSLAVAPAQVNKIRDAYDAHMVRTNVEGYDDDIGAHATTRPLSPSMKAFLDAAVLENAIPDHFDDVPAFKPPYQPKPCRD